MKSEKKLRELFERFTTDDVLRPQLRKPWIVGGKVYATDGRIAICADNALGLDYDVVQGDGDWRIKAAGDLDGWISESRAVFDGGKLERIELDFWMLSNAVHTAMKDARIYAVDHYPRMTDDIEEMTVDEAVARYSVVILPGSKRHVIAARYAELICDCVDAFGPVEFFVPADGFRYGDYGRYRIYCHGTGFDILLMAIRSDRMDAHGFSVADCATATLVHSLANDSYVNFALLQFGGATDGR